MNKRVSFIIYVFIIIFSANNLGCKNNNNLKFLNQLFEPDYNIDVSWCKKFCQRSQHSDDIYSLTLADTIYYFSFSDKRDKIRSQSWQIYAKDLQSLDSIIFAKGLVTPNNRRLKIQSDTSFVIKHIETNNYYRGYIEKMNTGKYFAFITYEFTSNQ